MAGDMGHVKLRGWKETQDRLDRLRKTAPQAVVIGMMALGEEIMADSVRRTPVDTGRLRSTAYVAPPRLAGDWTVELGYGTNYAVAVHERTEASHSTGEAKFLENAVLSRGARGLWKIAERAEKLIERGGEPPQTRYPLGPQEG